MLTKYAFDIETAGLRKTRDNHRLTAIMQEGEDDVTLMDWQATQKWLDDNSVMLIGHNIVGFDLEFFSWDDERTVVWDTFLMSKMLCRDPGYLHSLDECLRRIGIVHTEKELDASEQDWDINSLTPQQISYITQDVSLLFPLFQAMFDMLSELELLDCCRLEHKVRRVSNIMERNGLPMREQHILDKKAEATRLVREMDVPYNFNSYQQVSDVILGQGVVPRENRIGKCEKAGIKVKQHKTTGRTYIETHAEALQRCLMHDINPIKAREVLDAKRAAAPLKHIKWMEAELGDNRKTFHSRFDNLGTTTGRYSASGYAIQQMNRELRTCFGFEDDEPFSVVKADWSQMELRLHAALNDDPEMTDILEDDSADIHNITASRAFDVANPTAHQRNLGKTTNFALLYMAGWRRLWGQLIKEGNYVDADTAQLLWDTFHKQFPTVRQVGDRITSDANITFPDTYAVNIWGGLVRWVEWKRDEQGLWQFPLPSVMNAYIQGAGGAVLKRAILMLPEEVKQCLAATVHDELVVCCRDEKADEYADALARAMRLALRGALQPTKIPPKVDVTIAKTWGG